MSEVWWWDGYMGGLTGGLYVSLVFVFVFAVVFVGDAARLPCRWVEGQNGRTEKPRTTRSGEQKTERGGRQTNLARHSLAPGGADTRGILDCAVLCCIRETRQEAAAEEDEQNKHRDIRKAERQKQQQQQQQKQDGPLASALCG